MDNLTPELRSRHMRGVRREHTKPELIVRRLAHSMGFRFRLHRKNLPGSPDLTFPRLHKVIFVHGCFWHGHQGCRYATVPKTRTEWWLAKIAKNRERDALAIVRLRELGWEATVVWECETRKPAGLPDRLEDYLKSGLTEERLDLSNSVRKHYPTGARNEKCKL